MFDNDGRLDSADMERPSEQPVAPFLRPGVKEEEILESMTAAVPDSFGLNKTPQYWETAPGLMCSLVKV